MNEPDKKRHYRDLDEDSSAGALARMGVDLANRGVLIVMLSYMGMHILSLATWIGSHFPILQAITETINNGIEIIKIIQSRKPLHKKVVGVVSHLVPLVLIITAICLLVFGSMMVATGSLMMGAMSLFTGFVWKAGIEAIIDYRRNPWKRNALSKLELADKVISMAGMIVLLILLPLIIFFPPTGLIASAILMTVLTAMTIFKVVVTIKQHQLLRDEVSKFIGEKINPDYILGINRARIREQIKQNNPKLSSWRLNLKIRNEMKYKISKAYDRAIRTTTDSAKRAAIYRAYQLLNNDYSRELYDRAKSTIVIAKDREFDAEELLNIKRHPDISRFRRWLKFRVALLDKDVDSNKRTEIYAAYNIMRNDYTRRAYFATRDSMDIDNFVISDKDLEITDRQVKTAYKRGLEKIQKNNPDAVRKLKRNLKINYFLMKSAEAREFLKQHKASMNPDKPVQTVEAQPQVKINDKKELIKNKMQAYDPFKELGIQKNPSIKGSQLRRIYIAKLHQTKDKKMKSLIRECFRILNDVEMRGYVLARLAISLKRDPFKEDMFPDMQTASKEKIEERYKAQKQAFKVKGDADNNLLRLEYAYQLLMDDNAMAYYYEEMIAKSLPKGFPNEGGEVTEEPFNEAELIQQFKAIVRDQDDAAHNILGLKFKEKGYWSEEEINNAFAKKDKAANGEKVEAPRERALFRARKLLLDDETKGFYFQFRRVQCDAKNGIDHYAAFGLEATSSKEVLQTKLKMWKERKAENRRGSIKMGRAKHCPGTFYLLQLLLQIKG